MRTPLVLASLVASAFLLTACAEQAPGALGLAESPTPEATSLASPTEGEGDPADPQEDSQPTTESSATPSPSTDTAAPEADTLVAESASDEPAPDLELSTSRRGVNDPDTELCSRFKNRFPDNWWKQGDVFGVDLVETCKRIFQVIVVGDCLVMPDGSCPGADLSGANLVGARMARMNLPGANLSGANLTDAHMTSANLSNANLAGARFDNAQLYGVNLRGADVTGTSFAQAELRAATWVDGRRCSSANIRGRCG